MVSYVSYLSSEPEDSFKFLVCEPEFIVFLDLLELDVDVVEPDCSLLVLARASITADISAEFCSIIRLNN